MKNIQFIFVCLLLIGIQLDARTQDKRIDNLKSDNVNINTDYLDVTVFTWDKDYIDVKSELKINTQNGQEYHDLVVNNSPSGLVIESKVNVEHVPQMVITTDKEGNKKYTPVKEWNQNYNGKHFGSLNFGYEIDGKLIVYIPKNLRVETSSTYGDYKIEGSFASLNVHSTYGQIDSKLYSIEGMEKVILESTYDFVDLTLEENANASIQLHTSYGTVYTDLPLKSKGSKSHSKQSCYGHDNQYILNGGDVKIDIVATYDNIYLRTN